MPENKSLEKKSQKNGPFSLLSPWFEDDWFPSLKFHEQSGLSVSEDDKNVFIEAAMPGIKPENVEITYEKGVLWIKGQRKEEEKDKKRSFYRKATSSYSYHLTVPGEIDEKKDPEASYKDGIMTIVFQKSKDKSKKQIKVKRG